MGYSLEHPVECDSTPVANSAGEGLENIDGGDKGNGTQLPSPVMRKPLQRLGTNFPLWLLEGHPSVLLPRLPHTPFCK